MINTRMMIFPKNPFILRTGSVSSLKYYNAMPKKHTKMKYIFYKDTFILPQVLIYKETEDTELMWIPSGPHNVPVGAVVAGHKGNGDPLYLAEIWNNDSDSRAGNYDPHKHCAEYGGGQSYKCSVTWRVAVLNYSGWYINSLVLITNLTLAVSQR